MTPPPVEATAALPLRRAPLESVGAKVAQLFDRHARMVVGVCRALLRDSDEAEDAAQQTFLAAHRALLNGTVPRDDAAWLATIARNECRARIRKRMSTPLVVELDDALEPAAVEGDASDVAARNDDLRALRAAIADLPERQREALVLRELYGLSYEDVAAALAVSPPAVDSLLSRARRGLQERVRILPGLAHGALVVPASLREHLARVIPGFEPAEISAGAGVGFAGIFAKLAALPAAAKLGAATATVALGVGIGVEADRIVPRSSSGDVAAAAGSGPVVAGVASVRASSESVARRAIVDSGDRSGPGGSGDSGVSDRSGPSDSAGSGGSGSSGRSGGSDSSGHSGSSGSGSSGGSGNGSGSNDDDSSGPGPGPPDPPEEDNSGSDSGGDDPPREDNSGSGSGDSSGDNSGSGSGDSGSGSDNSGSGSDNSGSGSDNSGSGSGGSGSGSGGDDEEGD